MNRAVDAGFLERGDTLGPEDMNRFQPHQETKKRRVWARYLGIREGGQIVPDTSGLRLEELYRENPDSLNEQEQEGARNRVEIGKFSEARPVKA